VGEKRRRQENLIERMARAYAEETEDPTPRLSSNPSSKTFSAADQLRVPGLSSSSHAEAASQAHHLSSGSQSVAPNLSNGSTSAGTSRGTDLSSGSQSAATSGAPNLTYGSSSAGTSRGPDPSSGSQPAASSQASNLAYCSSTAGTSRASDLPNGSHITAASRSSELSSAGSQVSAASRAPELANGSGAAGLRAPDPASSYLSVANLPVTFSQHETDEDTITMAATDFDPVYRSRLELIGAPRPRLHLSVERFFRKGYCISF
jgi:hypothetical protein